MNISQKICIGCDHAAFDLKDKVFSYIKNIPIRIDDMGTTDPEVSVNYPDYAIKVAKSVAQGKHDCGILLCGTGLGMSMVANRFAGIRAALCNDIYSARFSRAHNNANILVMGGRILGDALACDIVRTFLMTYFDGERHADRLAIFDQLGESSK
ncbi:MAG: Ribose-5-phosphate isomerase B [Candidatus Magnetoglobus multicellularis str. Araruama]|uniref:Ribose-5-phosphate isomerase B n=1 Tax=Candidatus Magnetoglobus multicellularis str. Araruama TaxID=890399 RepID=A0A1V1P4S6_9BACT|nr:MAG: Ribose-5-phosphate isomerase B [Candidatus Magnetoglobus multicellularis str. Araruama]